MTSLLMLSTGIIVLLIILGFLFFSLLIIWLFQPAHQLEDEFGEILEKELKDQNLKKALEDQELRDKLNQTFSK